MVNFKEYIKNGGKTAKKKFSLGNNLKPNIKVAAIGGGVGLVIASSRNKSLFAYGVIGAIIGIGIYNLIKIKDN